MQKVELEAQLPGSKLQYTRKSGWHLTVPSTLAAVSAGKRRRVKAGTGAECVSACRPVILALVRRTSSSCAAFIRTRGKSALHGSAAAAQAPGYEALPDGYWEIDRFKQSIKCVSAALSSWNQQIHSKSSDCEVLTLQILLGLQSTLAPYRPAICVLLDALALLDMLSGFVQYAAHVESQGPTTFIPPGLVDHPGALQGSAAHPVLVHWAVWFTCQPHGHRKPWAWPQGFCASRTATTRRTARAT